MAPVPDRNLPGELFENTDYCQPFQCSPTACVACYFMAHSQGSHTVRDASAYSLDFTGSEHVCEVCQKLTCLPIDQPPPVGKELSMTDSTSANVPTNFKGAAKGAAAGAAANNPFDARLNRFNQPRFNQSRFNQSPSGDMFVNRAPDQTAFGMKFGVQNPLVQNNSASNSTDASVELPNLVMNIRTAEAGRMARDNFMPYALPSRQTAVQPQPLTPHAKKTARRHQFERHQFERTFFDKLLGRRRRHSRPKQPSRRPEPAIMPSTYQVPRRAHSVLLDTMATSVPFAILILMFSLGLVASVALVSPSFALWPVVSDLIIACLRVLFVAVVFSTAIAFVLEPSR